MSNNKPVVLNINGKKWRIVDDETIARPIYNLRDVVKAGGAEPQFASS